MCLHRVSRGPQDGNLRWVCDAVQPRRASPAESSLGAWSPSAVHLPRPCLCSRSRDVQRPPWAQPDGAQPDGAQRALSSPGSPRLSGASSPSLSRRWSLPACLTEEMPPSSACDSALLTGSWGNGRGVPLSSMARRSRVGDGTLSQLDPVLSWVLVMRAQLSRRPDSLCDVTERWLPFRLSARAAHLFLGSGLHPAGRLRAQAHLGTSLCPRFLICTIKTVRWMRGSNTARSGLR